MPRPRSSPGDPDVFNTTSEVAPRRIPSPARLEVGALAAGAEDAKEWAARSRDQVRHDGRARETSRRWSTHSASCARRRQASPSETCGRRRHARVRYWLPTSQGAGERRLRPRLRDIAAGPLRPLERHATARQAVPAGVGRSRAASSRIPVEGSSGGRAVKPGHIPTDASRCHGRAVGQVIVTSPAGRVPGLRTAASRATGPSRPTVLPCEIKQDPCQTAPAPPDGDVSRAVLHG